MEWKSNINVWRTRISYISTVISISLVLFVIGLLGLMIINVKSISDKVKENFECNIYLKDDAKKADLMQFKKMMEAKDFVISTNYIDEDSAKKILAEELDPEEQFDDIVGDEQVLEASIVIKMKAEYTHPDSLKKLETELLKNAVVSDVKYDGGNLMKIHENVEKAKPWLLGVSSVLLFIAIVLINNTLRLKVYSQRFLIRTMQLIGAKWSFIRKPFIFSALLQGIIGALLAIIMLMGFLSFLIDHQPDFAEIQNTELNLMLYAGLMGLGILITGLSTIIAVNKFLRLKTDELYY
ncbi:MAG: permease-like cell division protein FtsX [Bacteroidetes bacterium]|nr:permease-like cell division protein FtsX [Bacteroidota bacterium]